MLRKYRKPKKENRDYWYLAFGILTAATTESLVSHVLGLVNGSLSTNQFGAASMATLKHAHTMAYVYGAQSTGGDVQPADTVPYIDIVAKEQEEFLQGFIDQLEDKDRRYVKSLEELYPDLGDEKDILARIREGGVMPPAHLPDSPNDYYDEKAIQHRMRFYNERVRGTANWGAVDMLAPWEEIKWVDIKDESECRDCPKLAQKEYRKDSLPTVPGAGQTECGVFCRCELQLLDGTVIQF